MFLNNNDKTKRCPKCGCMVFHITKSAMRDSNDKVQYVEKYSCLHCGYARIIKVEK